MPEDERPAEGGPLDPEMQDPAQEWPSDEVVNLPTTLNLEFGLSLTEAKRIIAYGVEIDGERWIGGDDVPLSKINGKVVRTGDNVKKLVFTYAPVHDRYFG